MKRLSDSIVLLVATVVFGYSLIMTRRAVGLTSPWLVLNAMFCFLGLVTFARPLFMFKMPRWLRPVRSWEMRGGFYRAIGVPGFGELLRRTPLRYLQPLVYLRRNPGDPAKVQAQIEWSEAAHFWAAALLIPYMVYAGLHNWWGVILWFLVVQVVGNVYPIMHLRWVRGRLTRVLERKLQNHVLRRA